MQAGGLPPTCRPSNTWSCGWAWRTTGAVVVNDLSPLLRGDSFPELRYVGLRYSELGDDLAGVIALAPVVGRL